MVGLCPAYGRLLQLCLQSLPVHSAIEFGIALLQMQRLLLLATLGVTLIAAQPFQPGQNVAPLGTQLQSALCTRSLLWRCKRGVANATAQQVDASYCG